MTWFCRERFPPFMIINVKTVPGAKKNLLKESACRQAGKNGNYKVYLTAPAVEGKANQALIEYLADYFQVKKSQIEIIKGLKSRNKTVNIFA